MNTKAMQRFSTLALLILALTSGSAVAQEMCLPDCLDDEWSPQKEVVITLPFGCDVLVTFAQRSACGGLYQDVYIAGISPINFEHPSCVAVSQLDAKDYLEKVTELLLLQNPMGFEPRALGGSGCSTNWRVINGSCWSKSFHLEDSAVLGPCATTACCLKPYRVCVDLCGNGLVEALGPGTGGSQSCPVEWYPCEPVCG